MLGSSTWFSGQPAAGAGLAAVLLDPAELVDAAAVVGVLVAAVPAPLGCDWSAPPLPQPGTTTAATSIGTARSKPPRHRPESRRRDTPRSSHKTRRGSRTSPAP